MNKKERLESLINYFTDGNKSKFSALLGVKPQTINTWLTRDTFDAELIYAKCERLSGDWLLSGEGEMMKSDLPNDQPSVVSTIHARQSEVSVTQTNGASQSELVAHLKSLLEEKERTIQVQQQLIDALRKL